MRKLSLLLVLLALGVATRFLFVWHPAEVVFDEVHFGKFVSAYYTGAYYFDVHPPLGKLLIAGFAKFFGFGAGFDFDAIGEGYADIPYVALRFLPNLAGALIPAAVFGWLAALGVTRPAAFLAGLLLIFDNAILVQSHFILVDSFLMLFGFAGLWLFFRTRNRGYRLRDVALAGAILALSFSVKWTGLAFFGLALGVMLWDFVLEARAALRAGRDAGRNTNSEENRMIKRGSPALFVSVGLLIYLATFWVHFALLPNPGVGDAFMSRDFREKPFIAKTLELNRVMYAANQGLRTPHSYGSSVWSWPLMLRPVYYWAQDYADGAAARIYLLGNPVVWWFSTVGVIAALFLWRPKFREKKWIFYAGYLVNIIPFFFVQRVVFLYHYLPALAFAVAILAAWLADSLPRARFMPLAAALMAAVSIAFVFFAPFSYGLPLSEAQYTMRIWLPSWR